MPWWPTDPTTPNQNAQQSNVPSAPMSNDVNDPKSSGDDPPAYNNLA